MSKEVWINLPVKDLKKSKDFFEKLGFSFNTHFGESDTSAALMIGKNVVMLFVEKVFEGFSQHKITDTKSSNEVLISFSAASKEEVDEMKKNAVALGAIVFGKASEKEGWMYGFAFADLDGHRWNMLYMDRSKMPKK